MTIRQAEQIADLDEGDVDTVCKQVANTAKAGLNRERPVQDWAIANAINDLILARKRAKALEQAKKSGLPRTTDPWTDRLQKVKRPDATHWYLHDRDTSVTWYGPKPAPAPDAATAAATAATPVSTTLNVRETTEALVLPTIEARRATLARAAREQRDTVVEVGFAWITTQLAIGNVVYLDGDMIVTTVGGRPGATRTEVCTADPALTIAVAALHDAAAIAFAAADHPAAQRGYWTTWLRAEDDDRELLDDWIRLGYEPADYEQAWLDSLTAAHAELVEVAAPT